MKMTDALTLIGDIGGTNARFALVIPGETKYFKMKIMKCSDFNTIYDAIEFYLNEVDTKSLDRIFFAAASPILEKNIKITNNHWVIDKEILRQKYNLRSMSVINDFKSIAYAMGRLGKSNFQSIGKVKQHHFSSSDYSLAIIGPGTGLGGSGLIKRNGILIPSAAELGHIGFAPQNDLQIDINKVLKNKFNRIINESLLSGPGIENIYWALRQLNTKENKKLSAEEIFRVTACDELAKQSVELFFEILGQVAGDFVLALGAMDGLLLTGDIINHYPDMLKNSKFRCGFENKGDYQPLMKRIPTSLVTTSEMGLLGMLWFSIKDVA
jgi:glucokinase